MTLLTGEQVLTMDSAEATQALLVRTYLGRVRRRVTVRRARPSLPHGFPTPAHSSAAAPATDGRPEGVPLPGMVSPLTRPPLTGAQLVRLSRPPAADPVPDTVRSAVAFIEARADEPIGLTEIADAAGLSPRALQVAFRRHLGTTPLGHLRATRMARVHADLAAAQPGDGQTVSALASRWGISQLSRFARDYQQRYGVTPRQTLGRSTS